MRGSHREMVPFFNYFPFLEAYAGFAGFCYGGVVGDEDKSLSCAVSAQVLY